MYDFCVYPSLKSVHDVRKQFFFFNVPILKTNSRCIDRIRLRCLTLVSCPIKPRQIC